MTNFIRKVRFSISIGEIHSTYLILENMKNEGTLTDPHLNSMRITLKKKLMEEEEGLLSVAYLTRAEPKVSKYSTTGLGFTDTVENAPAKEFGMTDEDFMTKLLAAAAVQEEMKKKGNNDGQESQSANNA